jgi:GTP-binding protein HflX
VGTVVADPIPRALLLAVQVPSVDDEAVRASLDELGRLAATLGLDVAGRMVQKRSHVDPSVVVGEGKLTELAAWTGGKGHVPSGARKTVSKARARWEQEAPEVEQDGEVEAKGAAEGKMRRADLIVVDHELSPSQLRNLERACGCEVLDRAGLIVEIFHRHARSREARLQVEIARLHYMAPRLRETGGGERQRGGIGGKGAGESHVELDRRKIRDRISELKEELDAIGKEGDTRRSRRSGALTVALVGYTNAGKSSLMRALTGSPVYVADKLFATLDTTVRALHPETVPRILVTDTVGFIKKLPHDLVASFRSTLDQALHATLLLHVVDVSDSSFREQYEVTRQVLQEIGAAEHEHRLVLNKIDRLDPDELDALRLEFPDAWPTAAVRPEEVAALRERIVAHFSGGLAEEEVFLDWGQTGLIGEIRGRLAVLGEQWEDGGVRYRVQGTAADVGWLRQRLQPA